MKQVTGLHASGSKSKVTTGKRNGGFRRDEDGSLIIFGLFLFVLMLMIMGLAVDLMRFETHRARLQSTLDRAVLAAASLNQTLTPEEVVLDYFDRAGMGSYISEDDINATPYNDNSRQVEASASLRMPSAFMDMMGIEYLQAPAAGTAMEAATLTEISLIVDVSGSMSWDSSSGRAKIAELRDAAKQFVNIMQCNPDDPDATGNCTVEPDKTSITIVPYSEQVLAGETILDQLTVTNEHTYSSCVTFGTNDFNSVSIDPTVQLKRTGHFDARSSRRQSVRDSRRTCRTDSWRKILPYENDPADARTMIGNLGASGNTSIDVAMKWGTAFLDPGFADVVQGLVTDGVVDATFDDRPYLYTKVGVKKVIVLMTDGVNTSQYYLYENYRDGPTDVYYWDKDNDNRYDYNEFSYYKNRSGSKDYYWFKDGSWHTTPYGDDAAAELDFPELWAVKPWAWYDYYVGPKPGANFNGPIKDARLDAICDAAKSHKMEIFTVGFEVTSHSAEVMQSCASSPAHYFDVDGAELAEAFASIARQITALRLVN